MRVASSLLLLTSCLIKGNIMKEIAKFLGLNQEVILNPYEGNIGDYYQVTGLESGDKEVLRTVLASVEGTAYRDENHILLRSAGELYLIENMHDSCLEKVVRNTENIHYSALSLSHNSTKLGLFIYYKHWGDNYRTKFGGSKELMNYLGFEALPEYSRKFFKDYGYAFP